MCIQKYRLTQEPGETYLISLRSGGPAQEDWPFLRRNTKLPCVRQICNNVTRHDTWEQKVTPMKLASLPLTGKRVANFQVTMAMTVPCLPRQATTQKEAQHTGSTALSGTCRLSCTPWRWRHGPAELLVPCKPVRCFGVKFAYGILGTRRPV